MVGTARMRTLEVQYQQFTTMTGLRKEWVVLGERGTLFKTKKKKDAVKEAKRKAKAMSKREQASVGVKIFGKDGGYQRQHVYEP